MAKRKKQRRPRRARVIHYDFTNALMQLDSDEGPLMAFMGKMDLDWIQVGGTD